MAAHPWSASDRQAAMALANYIHQRASSGHAEFSRHGGGFFALVSRTSQRTTQIDLHIRNMEFQRQVPHNKVKSSVFLVLKTAVQQGFITASMLNEVDVVNDGDDGF